MRSWLLDFQKKIRFLRFPKAHLKEKSMHSKIFKLQESRHPAFLFTNEEKRSESNRLKSIRKMKKFTKCLFCKARMLWKKPWNTDGIYDIVCTPRQNLVCINKIAVSLPVTTHVIFSILCKKKSCTFSLSFFAVHI